MTSTACVRTRRSRRHRRAWRNGGGVTRELLRLAARRATGAAHQRGRHRRRRARSPPFPACSAGSPSSKAPVSSCALPAARSASRRDDAPLAFDGGDGARLPAARRADARPEPDAARRPRAACSRADARRRRGGPARRNAACSAPSPAPAHGADGATRRTAAVHAALARCSAAAPDALRGPPNRAGPDSPGGCAATRRREQPR